MNQCKVSHSVGHNYIPNTEGPGSASSSTTGTRLGSRSIPAEKTNVSICLPIRCRVASRYAQGSRYFKFLIIKIGYSFRCCYLLVKYYFFFSLFVFLVFSWWFTVSSIAIPFLVPPLIIIPIAKKKEECEWHRAQPSCIQRNYEKPSGM